MASSKLSDTILTHLQASNQFSLKKIYFSFTHKMKFSIVAVFLMVLIVDQLWTAEGFTAGRGPGRKRETKVRAYFCNTFL